MRPSASKPADRWIIKPFFPIYLVCLGFLPLPGNTESPTSSAQLDETRADIQKPDSLWLQPGHAPAESQHWMPAFQAIPKAPLSEPASVYPDDAKEDAPTQPLPASIPPGNTQPELFEVHYPELIIGQQVCTYSDNKYGKVLNVSKLNVNVSLIGQAKYLRDGVFFDAPEGALFAQPWKTLTFIPLNEQRAYSRLSITACQTRE